MNNKHAMTIPEAHEAAQHAMKEELLGKFPVACIVLSEALNGAGVAVEHHKNEYIEACKCVAQMHAAAVGYVGGPIRGVVEDVIDLKARADGALDQFNKALNFAIDEIKDQEQAIGFLRMWREGLWLEIADMWPNFNKV